MADGGKMSRQMCEDAIAVEAKKGEVMPMCNSQPWSRASPKYVQDQVSLVCATPVNGNTSSAYDILILRSLMGAAMSLN